MEYVIKPLVLHVSNMDASISQFYRQEILYNILFVRKVVTRFI